MASGGIALLVAALGTPVLIGWLRRRRLGQQIRDDGPFMHLVKAGTPTMGGVAMVLAAGAGYLLAHAGTHVAFSRSGVLVLLVTLCAGGIGLFDDWAKVRHRRSLGLTKRGKFGALVLMSVGFALAAEHWAGVSTHLSFTRWNSIGVDLGSVGWVVWAVFVIVGTANAVNLTDGLDGLAIGCTLIVAFVFLVFTYLAGNIKAAAYLQIPYVPGAGELTVFCAAMIGAGLGFLWFNCHPAQVFMGDTGSLALGGAFGTIAVLIHQPFVLVIAGGVFVLEAVSVILQTGWFRFTRKFYGTGRRIFLMAPLHHHFEKKGWYESQVVMRFYILCVLFAVVALATLKLR